MFLDVTGGRKAEARGQGSPGLRTRELVMPITDMSVRRRVWLDGHHKVHLGLEVLDTYGYSTSDDGKGAQDKLRSDPL